MELEALLALADRALDLLEGEGQVTVRPGGAVFIAVEAGRGGRAEADGLDEVRLLRAARTARLRARQARAWPVPEIPGPHEGIARTGEGVREAIANSAGTRVAQAYAVKVKPSGAPGDGDERVIAPGVVAAALAAIRSGFGVGLALGGEPPELASAVTLVDDSSVGLPRAFDAEGVPRRRVTLVESGRFVGGVHDTSSHEPSTGHSTRALTLAPRADHLVVAPGDDDLAAPGPRTSVDLRAVEAVGRDPLLVPLPGGGCALVPAVQVAR